MKPDQALFDEIYRRKLEHAKRFSPAERLLASLEHSDAMVEVMRAGVRHQFPDSNNDEVERLLEERVRRVRNMHERR